MLTGVKHGFRKPIQCDDPLHELPRVIARLRHCRCHAPQGFPGTDSHNSGANRRLGTQHQPHKDPHHNRQDETHYTQERPRSEGSSPVGLHGGVCRAVVDDEPEVRAPWSGDLADKNCTHQILLEHLFVERLFYRVAIPGDIVDTPSNRCLIRLGTPLRLILIRSGATDMYPSQEGIRMPGTLTQRQRLVLETIRMAISERGYPPTLREIGEAVGLHSPSSVKHQVDALERKGYLRRDPHLPRALELVEVGAEGAEGLADGSVLGHALAESAHVPVVGRIAAGGPILAEQAVEDVFTLPRRLVGDGELFLLRVTGDSMVDAAICDGDWVVVRRQHVAENGEVVAALLEDEATVKTLQRRDGHLWLMPANPAYSPILGDNATVLGKVVAVLRAL